jgi:predicted Zn finger-like uncharacterized protein
MNIVTTCPHCLTRFIVGRHQLQASQGQVKCAKCQHIFDYRNHLESSHEQTAFLGSKLLQAARRSRLFRLLLAALMLGLLAQTLFFARTNIMMRWPASQPSFIKACQQLHCAIKLPKTVNLIGLDDTELVKDENLAELIKFNALLSNNAPYTQAYPELELTLTDSNDQALMRKYIKPEAYLSGYQKKIEAGLAAGAELRISLNLQTTEPVAGFRAVPIYR